MSSVACFINAAKHESNDSLTLSIAGYVYIGRWTQISTKRQNEEASQECQMMDYLVLVKIKINKGYRRA